MQLRTLALTMLVLTSACAASTEDEFAPRGDLSESALAAGSCRGTCGAQSPDGCWCDDSCERYGDCCTDYERVCVAGTCEGNCGGPSEADCWCNDACVQFGDCCADYTAYCGGDPVEPDPELEARLREAMSRGHIRLSYTNAREHMYGIDASVDVHDGRVHCIYTGVSTRADGTLFPSRMINTEHVWPQSSASPSGSSGDLFNLRTSLEAANGARANHPYGETTCTGSACEYARGGSELGVDATGAKVFEVRPETRGNIARAKFYFAVRYGLSIPAREEAVLRSWHAEDPPDAAERARVDAVEDVQGNRNVFVDQPELVAQIPNF